MKIYVIDTNFLYSAINKDQPFHKEAYDFLYKMDLGTSICVMPSIVVAELLVSGFPVDLIAFCRKFSKKFENPNLADLKFIQNMPKNLSRKLKANDCIILAITKRKRAELLTFDENLKKVFTSL